MNIMVRDPCKKCIVKSCCKEQCEKKLKQIDTKLAVFWQVTPIFIWCVVILFVFIYVL
jgi:hypothetical protein